MTKNYYSYFDIDSKIIELEINEEIVRTAL